MLWKSRTVFALPATGFGSNSRTWKSKVPSNSYWCDFSKPFSCISGKQACWASQSPAVLPFEFVSNEKWLPSFYLCSGSMYMQCKNNTLFFLPQNQGTNGTWTRRRWASWYYLVQIYTAHLSHLWLKLYFSLQKRKARANVWVIFLLLFSLAWLSAPSCSYKGYNCRCQKNRKETVHNIIVAQMDLGSSGNHRTEPPVTTGRALDCSVKKRLGPAESAHSSVPSQELVSANWHAQEMQNLPVGVLPKNLEFRPKKSRRQAVYIWKPVTYYFRKCHTKSRTPVQEIIVTGWQ